MKYSNNGKGKSTSKNKVAVITGASSGIGRATAHEFARRGSKIIVASRNEKALDEVVKECYNLGGEATAVVMDVTKEDDVNRLARIARDKYGKLDIWVNNAGVTLFGRFEEVPTEDIRKVVETNLFGYMYGARAAIPHFREQGEGTLINVSSIVAVTGQPYTGAYVATKAAEKALSESLSQELMGEKNIHICTVMPAVTDTPIFQHGANYMGKVAVAPSPVNAPEMVAEIIVNISENPKKEVYAGAPGGKAFLAKAITPSKMYDKSKMKQTEKSHFGELAIDPSPGNLYGYFMDQLHGGWRQPTDQDDDKSTEKMIQAGMVIAGIALAFLAVWGYKKSRKKTRKNKRFIVVEEVRPARRKNHYLRVPSPSGH